MFNILTKVDKSAETRRNLHTHTHTHTCNLLLSPKQIGTICFTISLLISAPLFATDIPSSASTANCKYSPLQVYSGTSNLEAGWQANTIQLHWYNGDTEIQNVPSVSQSCVYDGTLTPPATIPTKTGYTFKGWRVRSNGNQQQSPIPSSVFSTNGDVFDYHAIDESDWNQNIDYWNAGEWAVEWYGTLAVYGESKCSLTDGTQYSTGTPDDLDWDPDGDVVADQYGTPVYCWCRATKYTPVSGNNQCTVAPYPDYHSVPSCDLSSINCTVSSYSPNGIPQCNLSSTNWVLLREGKGSCWENVEGENGTYSCDPTNYQECQQNCARSCAMAASSNSAFKAVLFAGQ